ncbi:baseplate J/gp47 family protein [Bordetella bronchialis]|uniref:baseplate assembly protein n=1 Tax=Bordetella bronchialis TaxID=463025 RepID=UPI003CFF628A
MADVSNPIDLSLLPAPNVVEPLNFEEILEARKARLLALFAAEDRDAVAKALALESEPLTIALEENSERELILRQRVNEAARAVLLAFARGADLEHIAAEYGVARLVIQPAQPNAIPPVDAVMEEDEDLRYRAQLAWEGLSTAGPRGAYEFHARSAHGQIADVTAVSPEPCDILVSVLSRENDGTASAEVLTAVRAALSDEDVRPMGDRVTVQSSRITPYTVKAVLYMKGDGPGRDVALAAARAGCEAYVYRTRRQGVSVWRSAITASLHVEGVDHLDLIEPAADIVLDRTQAGTCMGVDIAISDEVADA